MANSTPTGIDWRRAAQGAAAVLAAAVLGLTGAAQSTEK